MSLDRVGGAASFNIATNISFLLVLKLYVEIYSLFVGKDAYCDGLCYDTVHFGMWETTSRRTISGDEGNPVR
jgi:hypothetical protein